MIEYPFVYDQIEIDRLAVQGRFFAPLTKIFLEAIGLEGGIRILDIGCGGGDFSRCIRASFPRAGITSIDRDPTAIARAKELCLENVDFIESTLEDFDPTEKFDLVVGRFVLLYSESPAEQIRRAASLAKPGGVISFLEPDHASYCSSSPPNQFFAEMQSRIERHARRCRVTDNVGVNLRSHFEEGGLDQTRWITLERSEGGPGAEIYRVLAGTIAGMGRKGKQMDGLTADENDYRQEFAETLDTLETEAVANKLTVCASRLIGVWARTS